MNFDRLKELLDKEVEKRDNFFEVNYENPDPILVARRYKNEKIALICALFAYGNAKAIVKFLDSLDFSLLKESDKEILKIDKYYRFQKPLDVANLFLTLKRVDNLEDIFYEGYKKEENVLDGISNLIKAFKKENSYSSYGYNFLIGKEPKKKYKGESCYKRWNMYLRWMVRKDSIDFGLWKKIDKKNLVIPLDTHTFNVSKKIGLLNRKNYDLQAAIELTQNLKKFDPNDPVKYDFAIYRLGQGKKYV
ncbi:TIGR02757 family protein [Nitrosophilus kaiyonis]|uniref:TIGR02757 family protein n=1 Tax=Nitrosophilus kaiyonis TaxID=2930200 RepID=UPI00248FCD6B|nr:TIGR02757 family protein [Nitrosophilus kaiyonis]